MSNANENDSNVDEQDVETPPDAEQSDAVRNAAREAARYRKRAQQSDADRDAAVADRDAALARVEHFQRREVDGFAGLPVTVEDGKQYRLEKPADLFEIGGRTVDEFTNEDGDVDAELVAAAVAQLVAERPRLAVEVEPEIPRDPVAEALARHRAPGGGTGGNWAGLISPK
jgi:hypothetical protein